MRQTLRNLTVAAFVLGIAFALAFYFGRNENPVPIGVSANASQDDAQSYDGKTAAEWIELLSKSSEPKMRIQAAEALGFIARETRQTYGGFSDVPIDSAEPPKLSEEVLRSIIAALVAGLSDSQASVRASSAIALSWIGPRAVSAVPALLHQLEDADEDAREKALTAIGQMGPLAYEAIPRLRSLLGRGVNARIDVARALRLLGAEPDSFVPKLIAKLGEEESVRNSGHYAAMELGQLGDPSVPALLQAMTDKNSSTRKYAAYAIANMAGWDKLTKNREEVAHALIELLKDDESRERGQRLLILETQDGNGVGVAANRASTSVVSNK